MSRAKKGKEPGFETALTRLEEIVRRLEEGELPLEDSLRLFEEGVALTRQCAARLDEAQRRIDILARAEGGRVELRPLEVGIEVVASAGDDEDEEDVDGKAMGEETGSEEEADGEER